MFSLCRSRQPWKTQNKNKIKHHFPRGWYDPITHEVKICMQIYELIMRVYIYCENFRYLRSTAAYFTVLLRKLKVIRCRAFHRRSSWTSVLSSSMASRTCSMEQFGAAKKMVTFEGCTTCLNHSFSKPKCNCVKFPRKRRVLRVRLTRVW